MKDTKKKRSKRTRDLTRADRLYLEWLRQRGEIRPASAHSAPADAAAEQQTDAGGHPLPDVMP
jgi:hypothetical protein